MPKLRPLGDKILVKRLEAESKTKSGIVLPDSAKEKPKRGKVLSVGDGRPSVASGSDHHSSLNVTQPVQGGRVTSGCGPGPAA